MKEFSVHGLYYLPNVFVTKLSVKIIFMEYIQLTFKVFAFLFRQLNQLPLAFDIT